MDDRPSGFSHSVHSVQIEDTHKSFSILLVPIDTNTVQLSTFIVNY